LVETEPARSDRAETTDRVDGVDVDGGAAHYGTGEADDPFDYDVRRGTRPQPRLVQAFAVHKGAPFESLGHSARTHWSLVAVLAAIGMVLGAAFGYSKTPTYTAESRMVVGKTAQLSNLASIPGLDAAGQSLAAAYSRLASTSAVQEAVAKRLGGSFDGSVTASPIPLSPVLRVEGSASSSAQAVRLAKAGSAALVEEVNRLNTQQGKAAEDILTQFRNADHDLLAAQIFVNGLRDQYAAAQAARASGQTLDDLQTRLNLAQTEVDAAQVKKDALAQTYNGVFSPTALNSQILQSTGAPAATGSNRKATIQFGLLAGLVAGGLIGLGIGVWSDLRTRARLRAER